MTKTVRSSSVLPGTRGKQTREKILRAAARLVGRMGFRRTTITEIAEGAGIGKATVYLYFKDKQDILTYLVQKETNSILDQINTAVGGENTVAGQLRAFILTRYRSIHSLLELYSATPQLLLEDFPAIQQASQNYGEQELAVVQSLLDAGRAKGELALKDTQLAAIAITGTLRSLDHPWIFQHAPSAPIDLEQRVDDLVHHFLYGMIA
jgi:TetR/AcrR family transcriptional regulator, fatty acid metabolism regulator protein